jgi:hypothetical protein
MPSTVDARTEHRVINMQMQQMMASMGNITPEMMQQAQAQMRHMQPGDWERAKQQMSGMSPEEMARQAQAAGAQMSAQQQYLVNVRARLHPGAPTAPVAAPAAAAYQRSCIHHPCCCQTPARSLQ